MALKNLYTVLGVGSQAGPEELRRAWLRLAVKYHPDRNPGNARAEERFKDISQAYAILSDPEARARYDRTRPKPAWSKAAGTRGAPKAAPKAEPKAAPKAEPKTEPKAEPKAEPRAEPKAEPRAEPKAEPRAGTAGPRPDEPRPESKTRADEPPRPQDEPEDPSDWSEILNGFFKTPKGRDTLKELEEELRRAGLKFSSGRLALWLRTRKLRRPAAPAGARPAGAWLKRLRAWLPGGRAKAADYDIGYDLALSPEAAARGTTVEITYPRDPGPRELKINIPAGIKNGARLRLPDQGRLRPEGGRGDLVLTILILGQGQGQG